MTEMFANRRKRVLEQLAPDAVMILAAAPEILIGRDTHLRYVVDPEVYYLTGYTEPDAAVLLDPSADQPFTLFVRPRDPERELWNGVRGGVEAAVERFGADAAFPISELSARLPKLITGANTVYARTAQRPELDGLIQQAFVNGRSLRARSGKGPHIQRDPGDILDEMRLVKEEAEIALLREAARISAEAFLETIPRIRPGMNEWDVDALLEFGFRSRGASGPAFTTIAAAGGNATVLHYVDNVASLQAGELLLLDAGARYQMYCGDITRTIPVSGNYTPEQRTIYEIVLAAHDAALNAVAPGQAVDAIHEAARTTLLDGLISSGWLKESDRADDAALKRFFPHKTSHWLGLEVHDVGPYVRANGPVLLEPGMVLTIEPGLYAPHLRTGIRIEDDVLVTATGHDVLTHALPTAAADIEALMQ
jgi:Xaa-Pro aminopeptidase